MKKIRSFYEQKYKKLLLLPFLILLLAILQITSQYAITGDFLHKGITLKGGSTITIDYEGTTASELQDYLSTKFPKAELSVRSITSAGSVISLAVDSDAQEQEEIDALISTINQLTPLTKDNYSVEIIGSSLGQSFFKQTIIALLAAFLLMGLVVFFYFRSTAPSLAVILAAFSDIIVTLAVFNLTGIKLSSSGIAAFLMLIGYSVDTDILLSSRMLKMKGPLIDRVYSAMRTGLTMSATTIAAVGVALIFVSSDVVKQIMIILFIGLLVDLIMTWIQNVGVLRIYLEKKGHQ